MRDVEVVIGGGGVLPVVVVEHVELRVGQVDGSSECAVVRFGGCDVQSYDQAAGQVLPVQRRGVWRQHVGDEHVEAVLAEAGCQATGVEYT